MKTGMIIVRLLGGLGNQMFQYALGRHLSLERQVSLMLDTRPLDDDALRDYALGNFQVEARVALASDLSGLLPWPVHLPRKLAWMPRWPGRVPLLLERGYPFDPAVLQAPKSICLEGFWQSERYFSKVSDQIRHDFQLSQPLSKKRQAIAANIAKTNAISVHVRRGDYVSNATTQAFHGTCSPEWYDTTMSKMATEVNSPTFFIFSDDPDWARKNLPVNWPCNFIEPQNDGRDHEDMHLMSLCQHHIIANSSFSWWGAWLNPDPNKRVFAPAQWFANAANDTRDLLPDDWLKV